MSFFHSLIASGRTLYLPTDFNNLEYWYDATQIEGLSDGAEIVSLTDVSGNNKTLTPLSTLRRPTFHLNVLNGYPVIRFATSDNLVGVKADFDFMHQGDSTIFWVIKPTDNASIRYLFSASENSSANIGRTIRYATSNEFNDFCYAGTGAQDVFSISTTNDAVPVNEWAIIVTRYEHGKVGDDAELFINNNAILTDQGTLNPSLLTSTVNPTFFSLASGSANFIGDVATFFGYSRALTNDEINKIVGGLNFGL